MLECCAHADPYLSIHVGIKDGERIKVASRRGELPVEIGRIRPYPVGVQ
jgi:hypothetical protein